LGGYFRPKNYAIEFERAEILAKLDDALDYCMAWLDNANEAIESRETKS
jgi:hypothetical protein